MPSSMGSSRPRDRIQVSRIADSLPLELPGKLHRAAKEKRKERKSLHQAYKGFFFSSFPSFNFFLPTPTLFSFSPFPPAFLSFSFGINENECVLSLIHGGILHLNSKEIKPVNPKGNQPCIFIGRTDAEAEEAPILWLPDEKSQFIWRRP